MPLDIQFAIQVLLRRQVGIGEGRNAPHGDILVELGNRRITGGLAKIRRDVPILVGIIGQRSLGREIRRREARLVDRCGRGNEPAAVRRRVQVEAVDRLPGFKAATERQLEVRLNLPGILHPSRTRAGFALPIGVELTCTGGRGVIPDRRCVGRILQFVTITVQAKTDLLRTVVPERTPDALGIGVLPIGPIHPGDLAVRRVADAGRSDRERVELNILQIIIARCHEIEVEDALGVALDRDCVAQVSLVPDISIAGESRPHRGAAKRRGPRRSRGQIGLRIGDLVVIPDTQRISGLYEWRHVIGQSQVRRGLLRMRQRAGADDIGCLARLVQRRESAGRAGGDRRTGRVGQRLLPAVLIIDAEQPGKGADAVAG